ncbi:phthalate transporter [Pyricularia oryzae 70-15]|uniref:Phthalate transporter n=1 Tax=Pyricularia oryzae (strain 70-15 / ATCC MYA-4617 / FGSC 8958) TaxID=242507 RepID=G4N3A7_PYRO7|nr:phthalate transporter [Pyricularia oryzae 70-15]EHA53452.1 phthalate transporter [Pyricularia oryzae 70-15]
MELMEFYGDYSWAAPEQSIPSNEHAEVVTRTAKMERDEKTSVEMREAQSAEKVSPPAAAPAFDFASRDPDQLAEQKKKLLRKVDGRLLPLLILMYLFNFLDRSNLAQARQGTLEADLGMTGTDFNLATSIFFIGYLLMQLPSNLIITRVRPSLYLAGVTVLWGVVSACNGATRKFTDLIVVRFFLGFVEAPFFPGVIFLMSSWYTRAELTRRVAWFYSGSALANMFGGLLAAGILGNMHNTQGIAGWRWLFRALASYRLLEDIDEADEATATSVWHGVKLALKDYRLYLFVLLQHLSLLSQTFQYFFPSIVGTLGYGSIVTLLLTVPVWFATFLTTIAATFSASRTNDRSLHIIGLMLVATVGNVIATATSNLAARFFAMFLMPMGSVSAFVIIVPWIANSFPRPLVKRSACVAIANMIGNTASAYGSYMYPASAAPQYVPGGSANAVISLTVAILALVLRWLHQRENDKLERAEVEAGSGNLAETQTKSGFRFIY